MTGAGKILPGILHKISVKKPIFATCLINRYLLLVKCEGCADHPPGCPSWMGSVTQVEPTADTTIALSHIEVNGMLLVVSHSSQLREQTKNFERNVGQAVCLASEQTSCHQAIAESLAELKVGIYFF